MAMTQYSVVLSKDDEGNWLASVPALTGCHTWGKSREEALANAREAIEGCLESLAATGEPAPEEEPPVEITVVSV
jgi:predicted RNase H-like HicB family nuclease